MDKFLKQKKLLIFDLDETIYDHQFASLSGLKAIFEAYPIWQNGDLKTVENMYFEDLHNSHLHVIDGNISEETSHLARFEKIAKHFKFSFPKHDYLKMIEIYNKTSQSSKRAIPYAPETIASLKKHGFTIALITNGRVENQKRKITLCNIDTSLDFVLISEEVGIRKPAKEIFELALQQAKMDASEAVMIGDSWDSDILGAQGAKIQPIWVNRGRHQNHHPETIVEIQHVRDLFQYL